ncbi:hypothetical protein LTR56_002146 [Elasticomyces elasticus]|nr:hypothetical protein LTR56_002146 [Elasticomyces elasticus]KAK3666025.1 hypothetical protein LTR22_003028 [Elasticomyces elasticus]KAK4929512.1 hypothetical protein LTR49_003807 [Elasticomyces elasticus]KAK5767530.1 hypothetical protein LTS12_002371 [Elasticomyces elasticus]
MQLYSSRYYLAVFTLFSTSLAAPTTLVARDVTGCNDGEVAIGNTQLCQIGNPNSGGSCGQLQGQVYANDCGIIAAVTSFQSNGWCNAGWSDGVSVDCDDSGHPTYVRTQGGDFANCYGHGGSCYSAPYSFHGVEYCCSRV